MFVFVCFRWTTQTIPLVNPTAETLELLVTNSNPRNYTVEMDSGSTVSTHTHIPVCALPLALSAQYSFTLFQNVASLVTTYS